MHWSNAIIDLFHFGSGTLLPPAIPLKPGVLLSDGLLLDPAFDLNITFVQFNQLINEVVQSAILEVG
jgi:hypothetical protein